jgi:hypothetical protein
LRFAIAVAGIFAALSVRAGCMPLAATGQPAGPGAADTAVESGNGSNAADPDPLNLAASNVDATSDTPLDPAIFAAPDSAAAQSSGTAQQPSDPPKPTKTAVEVDASGNPIPLERQQPQRILGFMPNFRSVSGGAKPHPPGFKYNFTVATRQAWDYSSFIFLGLTTLSAEGINEHPVLGKGVSGFYSYVWRGFLDKTDGTYLAAWLMPSLLHEDTRNYALGNTHSIPIRILYVISRQGVARTYSGHQTPNIAGLGAKVLTQIISRTYYPTGATSFGVLAEKFGYSAMRDIMFTSIREFYPDIAAHYIKKHRAKMLRVAELDESAAPGVAPAATCPQ